MGLQEGGKEERCVGGQRAEQFKQHTTSLPQALQAARAHRSGQAPPAVALQRWMPPKANTPPFEYAAPTEERNKRSSSTGVSRKESPGNVGGQWHATGGAGHRTQWHCMAVLLPIAAVTIRETSCNVQQPSNELTSAQPGECNRCFLHPGVDGGEVLLDVVGGSLQREPGS